MHPNLTRHQSPDPNKLTQARTLRRQMAPAETVLWQMIRNNAIEGFHFRRQQVAYGYILDFYCARAGLAIELDGVGHLDQVESDRRRDAVLRGRGVRVLRLTNDEVLMRSAGVVRRIREMVVGGEDREQDAGGLEVVDKSETPPLTPPPAGEGH